MYNCSNDDGGNDGDGDDDAIYAARWCFVFSYSYRYKLTSIHISQALLRTLYPRSKMFRKYVVYTWFRSHHCPLCSTELITNNKIYTLSVCVRGCHKPKVFLAATKLFDWQTKMKSIINSVSVSKSLRKSRIASGFDSDFIWERSKRDCWAKLLRNKKSEKN